VGAFSICAMKPTMVTRLPTSALSALVASSAPPGTSTSSSSNVSGAPPVRAEAGADARNTTQRESMADIGSPGHGESDANCGAAFEERADSLRGRGRLL